MPLGREYRFVLVAVWLVSSGSLFPFSPKLPLLLRQLLLLLLLSLLSLLLLLLSAVVIIDVDVVLGVLTHPRHFIDIKKKTTMKPTRFPPQVTFGALGDSFYEYLLKAWLQGGKTEPTYREM